MKKYKMLLKMPTNTNHDMWMCGNFKKSGDWRWHAVDKNSAFKYSMEEIDKMDYGLVIMYDIIEVKEQLYYIKMPYTDSEYGYVNEIVGTGKVTFGDKIERCGFKTKFTKKEIEEKYPLYANDTYMFGVLDVK